MRYRRYRKTKGLGGMLLFSLAIHSVLFFLAMNLDLLGRMAPEPVYYVDMVNLPVANPQKGSPAPAKGPESAPPEAPAPTPPQPQAMTVPAKPKTAAKAPAATAPVAKAPAAQPSKQEPTEEQRFQERMARLRDTNEKQRMEDVFKNLERRTSGQKGPQGMPSGTGTEAGSDYASYVQSRLKDAFETTIAYQSGRPEVVVRLTIDRRGTVLHEEVVRSSGDRLFDDSVRRAIALAKKNIPPPPNGRDFTKEFRFRPEGIDKR